MAPDRRDVTEGETTHLAVRRLGGVRGRVTIDVATENDSAPCTKRLRGNLPHAGFRKRRIGEDHRAPFLRGQLSRGHRTLFLRLSAPSGGAALDATHSAATVYIHEIAGSGGGIDWIDFGLRNTSRFRHGSPAHSRFPETGRTRCGRITGPVTDVRVRLVGLNASSLEGLVVWLEAPDGTSVLLLNGASNRPISPMGADLVFSGRGDELSDPNGKPLDGGIFKPNQGSGILGEVIPETDLAAFMAPIPTESGSSTPRQRPIRSPHS